MRDKLVIKIPASCKKLGHIGGGPAKQDNTEGRLENVQEPVETERLAPSNGMKLQSELLGNKKRGGRNTLTRRENLRVT